jgi:hypothetical protein
MSKPKKTTKAPEAQASTATAVATAAPLPATAVRLPVGVKIVKRITMPSLALKQAGVGRALYIRDEMRISTVKDKSTDKPREPATICTVADVETGEEFTFIVPAVVRENLQRDYPNGGYVGKTFWICNKGKRTEAQRYNDFEIAEVDVSELTERAQQSM